MSIQSQNNKTASELLLKALSRWGNEGGAGLDGPQEHALDVDLSKIPPLTNAELAQLRIRVIALENLMIMMLAQGTDRQFERAREMAAYIPPRPGFTHHPLTTKATTQMVHLVDRPIHFRNVEPS